MAVPLKSAFSCSRDLEASRMAFSLAFPLAAALGPVGIRASDAFLRMTARSAGGFGLLRKRKFIQVLLVGEDVPRQPNKSQNCRPLVLGRVTRGERRGVQ